MSNNIYYPKLILCAKHTILTVLFILFIFLTTNLHALTSDCNFEGFAEFETRLDVATYSGGGAFRDWETSQDHSQGTGVGGSNDISSGCRSGNADVDLCPDSNCNPDSSELNPPETVVNTCGTATSAFRGIIDPMGNTNFDTCNQENLCTDAIPGSDCDDFLTLRVRVDEDPKAGNFAHLDLEVWQFIIDIRIIDNYG